MVFMLDGCSFHYSNIWSKSGISICWKRLLTSKESSNPIYFSKKTYFTSYVRNMFWATILFKYHDHYHLFCDVDILNLLKLAILLQVFIICAKNTLHNYLAIIVISNNCIIICCLILLLVYYVCADLKLNSHDVIWHYIRTNHTLLQMCAFSW